MSSFINELNERTYFTHILVIIVNENKFFQSNDFIKLTKLYRFEMSKTIMLQLV